MEPDRPIIAVADDLSGASEIAGTGWRYGLEARVVTRPDLSLPAGLTVIDTGTRAGTEAEAEATLAEVGRAIRDTGPPVHLFKKIDSVLRGHVRAEARVMMEQLGYRRALLAPANPSKGRIIRAGRYYIDGRPLDQTPFADDPDHPRTSRRVAELLKAGRDLNIACRHLDPDGERPRRGLYSVDITDTADLRRHIERLEPGELCCGAADAFEQFLRSLGLSPSDAPRRWERRKGYHTLLLNGSTVRNRREERMLREQEVPLFTLREHLDGDQAMEELAVRLQEALDRRRAAGVKVGLDEIDRDRYAGRIETAFGELAARLLGTGSRGPFHLLLTGGATAASVLDRLGCRTFEVLQERGPGVVTLAPDAINGMATTKPGSYPWPGSAFRR